MSISMQNQIELPGVIYHEILRPDPAAAAAFAVMGAADVHEGMSEDRVMDPEIRPIFSGARIAGPALTVLCAAGDTLMMHRALALSRPGDVIVIATDQPTLSAMWGNLVTTSARARGLAGAIVDGPVRDTASIQTMQFPVWSRCISPRRSTRKGPGCINVPIWCGGVLVQPGDLIVADDDGVVVVPSGQIDDVLVKARMRGQREAEILPKLEKGITPYEALGMEKAVQAAGIPEILDQYPRE
jgi:4-hydroxy-4-methyl-2-oxoglutarate aldolase